MLRLFIVGFILYILTAFTPDTQFNSEIKLLKKELHELNGRVLSGSKEISSPFSLSRSHPVKGKFVPFFSE